MLYDDLIDVAIEPFGGYCPALVPANLPPGAANIAQDVMFPQTGVRTRGGLGALAFAGAQIPGAASVTGLKTFLTLTGGQRLMIWDTLGDLFKEDPDGTLSLINSRPYQNLYYQSQTMFGREYQAFFNALGGADIPRQYDDTYWDRVSQGGPGASPSVTSFTPKPATIAGAGGSAVNIVASPGGIEFGGLKTIIITGKFPFKFSYYTYATINTTTPHGLANNSPVVIAGSTSTPSINGNKTVLEVVSPTSFTISVFAEAPATNGGGGTAQGGGAALIRVNNLVTATTSAAHGFQVGWQVQVAAVPNTAIGGGINSISRDGNGVVTVTTATAHGLVVDDPVLIANVTNPDNSFNGAQTVSAVVSPTVFQYQQGGTAESSTGASGNAYDVWTGVFVIESVPSDDSFTYSQMGPNDSSGTGGTATVVPQMIPGPHQVSVAFVTRQGSITPAAPPTSFSADGIGLAALNDIATGPPNIQARLILFTTVIVPPGTTGPFYSITQQMLIQDNTTTAAIFDFNEATLASGFQADYLFSQIEIGECACMLGYNSRTAWLGERARVLNFVNLGFEGGFDDEGVPYGWNVNGSAAGAGSAIAEGLPVDYGDAYVIAGSGLSNPRGQIAQSAYQDYLGVPIIQPNTSYSLRARLAYSGTVAPTQLQINLQSASAGIATVGLSILGTALKATFVEYIVPLTDNPLAIVPTDLLFCIGSGGGANGGFFIIDSLEVFPTNSPYSSSTARLSRAFNPESFDSVTGQVQVRPGDGQSLRAGFPLRNSLYLAKDHYLGYVTDDGVNEPASWAFTEVSATVGICGPNAVDWNEEWAVFAERSGFYICWGSDPVKLTPEIQTDASFTGRTSWASINWNAATTIWVRIDKINKQILIGAPINGATSPNIVFMLDYQWLEGAEDIASSPFVTYSAFTGKILGHGRGRRWALWNIAATSMCFSERSDGSAQPFYGGTGNGTIFWQRDVSLQNTDNGAQINWQYQSYFAPSTMEEQQYQLRSHLKLCGYMKFRVSGSGTLSIAISTATRSTIIRGYTMNPGPDGERPVNLRAERFAVTLHSTAAGDWMELARLVLCMKKDSVALVRGVSA